MASINQVILIGNLGADPENRAMPSGEAVCNIRLATTENWKDKGSGEKRELTEWHRVVMYRKLAEIANQYLRKGSAVYIEGRLRSRKWQDKDGQERYTTEIEASEMKMLSGRQDTPESSPVANHRRDVPQTVDLRQAPSGSSKFGPIEDDTIPF